MKSFIKGLWLGNIVPSDDSRQNTPEMEELRARFEAEAEARRPKKVRFIQINWGARRLTKAE